MRKLAHYSLVAAVAVPIILVGGDAFGQVPDHAPGTICFTDVGVWCWASPPGPPGSNCVCPTSSGMLGGTLG